MERGLVGSANGHARRMGDRHGEVANRVEPEADRGLAGAAEDRPRELCSDLPAPQSRAHGGRPKARLGSRSRAAQVIVVRRRWWTSAAYARGSPPPYRGGGTNGASSRRWTEDSTPHGCRGQGIIAKDRAADGKEFAERCEIAMSMDANVFAQPCPPSSTSVALTSTPSQRSGAAVPWPVRELAGSRPRRGIQTGRCVSNCFLG